MSFKTKKLVLFLIALVFILALLFFRTFFLETSLGMVIFLLFIAAYVIINLAWWRCDKCNRYLGKLSIFATHCPFCGEELE